MPLTYARMRTSWLDKVVAAGGIHVGRKGKNAAAKDIPLEKAAGIWPGSAINQCQKKKHRTPRRD